MNNSYNMNIYTGEKTWLTPPEIINALGPFDLDPCCPTTMPWRTATQMVHWPDDGLKVDWTGKRVWLNPPYGREAVPFLRKMAENKRGGHRFSIRKDGHIRMARLGISERKRSSVSSRTYSFPQAERNERRLGPRTVCARRVLRQGFYTAPRERA